MMKHLQFGSVCCIPAAVGIALPKCDTTMPWPKLCRLVESLRPVLNTKQVIGVSLCRDISKSIVMAVTWKEKELQVFGGIIRDDSGNMISAFSVPIDCNSNNQAEAIAAKFGVHSCISLGIRKFPL